MWLLNVIDYADRALALARPWRKKTVIVQPYTHDSPFCGLSHYHISWFPYIRNNMWASPKIGTSTLWESSCLDAVMNLNRRAGHVNGVMSNHDPALFKNSHVHERPSVKFEVNRSCSLVTKLFSNIVLRLLKPIFVAYVKSFGVWLCFCWLVFCLIMLFTRLDNTMTYNDKTYFQPVDDLKLIWRMM